MKNALYAVVGSTKEENQSKKRRKRRLFFIQLPLKKDLDAISRSRFFGRPGIPENSQI